VVEAAGGQRQGGGGRRRRQRHPGAITANPLPRTRDEEGRWIGGSPSQWVEELTDGILNHNASGFTLFPRGNEPYDVQLARWSQEVVPAVRAAIS
jgi:hypothetical protein